MAFQTLRGTTDLTPEALGEWDTVEQTAKEFAKRFGYREIRTPVIEDSGLFLRSVGESSDIVQKEMFTFQDRGGRTIALRPEGTSAIVRAYLERHLEKTPGLTKLFYLGPMFRAERPQAGRLRQFHQFGAEALGSSSPWVDADLITLCVETLRACGLEEWTLLLSSMGCRDDQRRSADRLRERLRPRWKDLCEECRARCEKNVFRVLDCKRPGCRAIAWDTNEPIFLLCQDCQVHFDAVREALRRIGIAFDDTKVFARGLDYYTRTVFEVRTTRLGAQDAVAAGGRYDHLVEDLGGPATAAIGYAAGIERLLMATHPNKPAPADGLPRTGLYMAVTVPQLIGEAFELAHRLRGQGISTTMDFEGRSLKAQLRDADRLRYHWVAIMGEEGLKQDRVTVKNLADGSQNDIALEQFVNYMAQQAGVTAANP